MKKAKAKKGGKKDAKGEKEITGPPAPEKIDENHKDFYVMQIKDLEERVSMYQKKCDDLEIKNAVCQVRLDRIIDDQNDVVSFIQKKLEKKTEEIRDLEENLDRLQNSKSDENKLYKDQLEAITKEYNEVKDTITRENQLLENKIASLEEFKLQRQNLYMEIKQLETELFNQEAEHRDARYVLDKQHLIEKDKLKQEMIEQVKVVANEFKRASQMQMSETSKRTIRENVAVNNQLVKMSEKTAELIEENDGLKQKIAKQNREIKILEENEKKLIKKIVCNHQTLVLLKAKCQTLGETLTRGVIETRDRLEELVIERKALTYELKQATNSLKDIFTKNNIYAAEKERLKEEVREKNTLRIELEKLISMSAIAIEKVIKPGTVGNCNQSQTDSSLKREELLEVLLLLLNSSQMLPPSSSGSSKSLVNLLINQSVVMDDVPRYHPGYLGLVPYPYKKNSPTQFAILQRQNSLSQTEEKEKQKTCQYERKSSPKVREFDPKLMAVAGELITELPFKGYKLQSTSWKFPGTLPPIKSENPAK